jgi:hypothetical protein
MVGGALVLAAVLVLNARRPGALRAEPIGGVT